MLRPEDAVLVADAVCDACGDTRRLPVLGLQLSGDLAWWLCPAGCGGRNVPAAAEIATAKAAAGMEGVAHG